MPFLYKILEKVVLHQLLAHLQEINICNPFQSAYCTGHSTETALLRVVNDLLTATDDDKISVLLSLHLRPLSILLITKFFSRVSKLSSASVLPHSSGFDRIYWTEISPLLSTILLPLLLLWCLEFHSARCWVLYCLSCTLLHFQTS